MKIKYFTLAFLVLLSAVVPSQSIAQSDDNDVIVFNGGYPPTNNGGGSRIPAIPIIATIEGNIINFSPSFCGYVIVLLESDGSLVYSATIEDNGSVEIPEYLTGSFIINLYINGTTHSGFLTLSQTVN